MRSRMLAPTSKPDGTPVHFAKRRRREHVGAGFKPAQSKRAGFKPARITATLAGGHRSRSERTLLLPAIRLPATSGGGGYRANERNHRVMTSGMIPKRRTEGRRSGDVGDPGNIDRLKSYLSHTQTQLDAAMLRQTQTSTTKTPRKS